MSGDNTDLISARLNFVFWGLGQVVIKDFSSFAVETFLKFLYKGTVDAPPEIVCEVSVIADKYQVLELRNLCVKTLEDSSSKMLYRHSSQGMSRVYPEAVDSCSEHLHLQCFSFFAM